MSRQSSEGKKQLLIFRYLPLFIILSQTLLRGYALLIFYCRRPSAVLYLYNFRNFFTQIQGFWILMTFVIKNNKNSNVEK